MVSTCWGWGVYILHGCTIYKLHDSIEDIASQGTEVDSGTWEVIYLWLARIPAFYLIIS